MQVNRILIAEAQAHSPLGHGQARLLDDAVIRRVGACPSCIYFGGTPEQIKTYVPSLLAGRTIGMMALTESGVGSDAAGAMKLYARRDGDVYRIRDRKMFASIANETDSRGRSTPPSRKTTWRCRSFRSSARATCCGRRTI